MKAYKIRIPNEEASRQVQEAAFSMGYEWAGFEKGVQNTQEPHLFFGESGKITWTGKSDGDVAHFNASENEEIHWKDFIQLASKSLQPNKELYQEGDKVEIHGTTHKVMHRREGYFLSADPPNSNDIVFKTLNLNKNEFQKQVLGYWDSDGGCFPHCATLSDLNKMIEALKKYEPIKEDSLSDKYSFDDEWLEQFLKEKGIKEKVLQRIAEQYGEEGLKEELNYSSIQGMFEWINTPEGHKYWSAINDEWIEYYKAMKKDLGSLNEESSPEAYDEAQDKCGLKVGDRVKVKGKTESNEGGWRNYWNPLMDKYVGKIGKITNVRRNVGVQVMFGGDAWHFPFFVLEKVEENEDQQSTYSSIDDCLLKRIQEIDWHVESSGAAGLGTFITKPSLSDSLKKAAKPKKKKKVKPRLHKRKPLF
jgi:hypothetical protein